MTDVADALHAEDAAARARALDVTASFIVQAPAGSGKTELLIQRFLALLSVVPQPECVLAITFTRKAAAEMRHRILAALQSIGDPVREARLQPGTRALAARALEANAERHWDLLGNPSRLRLHTIDALNQSLARRMPVLSRLGAAMAIEEDPQQLYEMAAERLLEHLPAGNARYAEAVGLLLEHLDNNVQSFVALVAEMLTRREAWLPELPGDVGDDTSEMEIRASLESARIAIVCNRLADLHGSMAPSLLREATAVAAIAASHLNALGADSPILAALHATTPPKPAAADLALWNAIAELLLTQKGESRRQLNIRQGVPPDQPAFKARAHALLEEFARVEHSHARLESVRALPPATYSDAEWRVLKAQFLVLRLAAAELQLVFAERGVADYPQFATAAVQSLGTDDEPTDVALAFDATLSHVLVDEFQDTSEAQVRLLRRLTRGWQQGDGRTLFLVGDPMQSIYRFRNAEVGLFLNVREDGLGDVHSRVKLERLTLRVNFRSTEPIVEWVNDCFSRVLPAADQPLLGAVAFEPSVSRPGTPCEGGVRVHAISSEASEAEAERVVEIVRSSLAEDEQSRIAVLVQGRSHLLGIVSALQRHGIAFQATDIDPLNGRPAVNDVMSIARALANPADRTAWLAVLRAPWCGLTLVELHALAGHDDRSTVLQLLRDPQRQSAMPDASRVRLRRTLAALETGLMEVRRFGLRDAVERCWHALAGPATLQDARELDEVRAGLDALANVLQRSRGRLDLQSLERALGRLYATTTAQAGIRVELLTIHKSKGLQFDVVIVPGLDRRGARDGKRLLQWTKLPDRSHDNLVVAPVAPSGGEPSPLYGWLQALEQTRLEHEHRRLLYVAATRAKRRLHLLGVSPARVNDPSGRLKLEKPHSATALRLLWPVVESEFVAQQTQPAADVSASVPAGPLEPPLRHLPADWLLPDCPPGPQAASAGLQSPAERAAIEFDWASESARHVGTLVHRHLERCAAMTPLPSPEDDRRHDLDVIRLAELGVPPGLRAAAAERVRRAVSATLSDPRGRWLLDATHRHSATELALTGLFDTRIISIVIDRTFVDEQGTRWIIDYKTSSHEGTGLDEFLDREQERYRAQLETYAALVRELGPEPVSVALYFPLLSAWRTWQPPATTT
jgi:ATP-dependent exoDNAse (exonuclease V) beta subunit